MAKPNSSRICRVASLATARGGCTELSFTPAQNGRHRRLGCRADRRISRIELGCGSFEVSWLRCENVGFAVFGVVDTLVFAAEVVVPVGVEVAAGDEGAEPEDGLGAFQPPSRARYVHSILDDVPARAFDDPGGDGPAFLQRPGVVQVVLLV